MEMICKVGLQADLGHGVWIADMDPTYLPFFGKPLLNQGKRTVLGLLERPSISADGRIEFDIKYAKVLTLGTGETVVLVQIAEPEGSAGSSPEKSIGIGQRTALSMKHAPIGHGDDAFISACKQVAMPPAMVLLGKSFLGGVREFADDQLIEGKARKWVTSPKNFLAITIQNRKKDLAIHVRKTSVLQDLRMIDVRDDRPGYARFWLQDQSQLQDALAAARASYVKC